MERFTILKNGFLTKQNVIGYYHQEYLGFKQPGNPNFINTLKNTFSKTDINELISAKRKVVEILKEDLFNLIEENNFNNCICVAVPRAKRLGAYTKNQLLFREAVSEATKYLKYAIDGSRYIERVEDTYTTHLKKATMEGRIDKEMNKGDEPYVGITKNTCEINARVKGSKIILIDDIYTKTINVDEDCIQALFDYGAEDIIYYSIGYTI